MSQLSYETNDITKQSVVTSTRIQSLGDRAIECAKSLWRLVEEEQTALETKYQKQRSDLVRDKASKSFLVSLTDQALRPLSVRRIAAQVAYLCRRQKLPKGLPLIQRGLLRLSLSTLRFLPWIFVHAIHYRLRQELKGVILSADKKSLADHLKMRKEAGLGVTINALGEAVLGEKEAQKRLDEYSTLLMNPHVAYVSIKISTLYSQINHCDPEGTIQVIKKRLRVLYELAITYAHHTCDGCPKEVNLDMESQADLRLTVMVFKTLLDEEDLLTYSGGIVIQAYLPESVEICQDLIQWSKDRVSRGGAPIRIRVVKGANLATEQIEASLEGWESATYASKAETDANFKRLLMQLCRKETENAVHVGVGSHNIFDIAFAMSLREIEKLEVSIRFEMLEGMCDPLARVLHKVTGNVLLYCPIATQKGYHNAVAYLIRRLDEQTGEGHFLRDVFQLSKNSETWEDNETRFRESLNLIETLSESPNRQQNRQHVQVKEDSNGYKNEPNTDWTLPHHQEWAQMITQTYRNHPTINIPTVIQGELCEGATQMGQGMDPSEPDRILYHYAKMDMEQLNKALTTAEKQALDWSQTTRNERSMVLARVAYQIQENRAGFIGALMMDVGKLIPEADAEVSEAIDFVHYYRRSMNEWAEHTDLRLVPKGVVVVTPPWNFPCGIAVGCISAALMAGNVVLFKPSSHAVWVGWQVVNAFWDAGIPKEVLQFVPCDSRSVGTSMVMDNRVSTVMLTGSSQTAQAWLQKRPNLNLIAETGGKNTLIVSAMADRDDAIKAIVRSAFGYSGQKCSAVSLVICEAEVYDDPLFREQLRDAAGSLKVGPAWSLCSKMGPLIKPASGALNRALMRLERGETWLLKPHRDHRNTQLWSPGIRWGVTQHHECYRHELFGPVIGVMRATSMKQAIKIANGTPYGLTAGLQTLDNREMLTWVEKIDVGNYYINRHTTGAIVKRQPFGGCKWSSIGQGLKAGGPHYLSQLVTIQEKGLPRQRMPLTEKEEKAFIRLVWPLLTAEERRQLLIRLSSYAYWKDQLTKARDRCQIKGESNYYYARPVTDLIIRVSLFDRECDVLSMLGACQICGVQPVISVPPMDEVKHARLKQVIKRLSYAVNVRIETDPSFLAHLQKKCYQRLRMTQTPSKEMLNIAHEANMSVRAVPVLSNGRVECLHYLQELTVTYRYHRYGYIPESS